MGYENSFDRHGRTRTALQLSHECIVLYVNTRDNNKTPVTRHWLNAIWFVCCWVSGTSWKYACIRRRNSHRKHIMSNEWGRFAGQHAESATSLTRCPYRNAIPGLIGLKIETDAYLKVGLLDDLIMQWLKWGSREVSAPCSGLSPLLLMKSAIFICIGLKCAKFPIPIDASVPWAFHFNYWFDDVRQLCWSTS